MIPSSVVGTTTGTGAPINVVVGFLPDYVKVVNRVTGSFLERFRASGVQSNKTVVAGTITVVTTTNAITDFAGTANSVGEGFTIPADAQVNVNTNAIDYLAIRSGPGAQ